MKVSPILSASGEPVFLTGGDDAFKVERYRGWVVSLEWARRKRKFIRVMCIRPERREVELAGTVAPGVWSIAESALVHFVGFTADGKCTGSASSYCIEQVVEALPILGKDRNDKQAAVSLVDTIIKFAPELVRIPYAPTRIRQGLTEKPMWDVEARNKSTGKTISEASV